MHWTEHFWSSWWNPKHHPELGPQFQQPEITGVKLFCISAWAGAPGSFKVMGSIMWILVIFSSPAGLQWWFILGSICLDCLLINLLIYYFMNSLIYLFSCNFVPVSVILHIPVVKWHAAFSPVTECTPSTQSWVCQSDLVVGMREGGGRFSLVYEQEKCQTLHCYKNSEVEHLGWAVFLITAFLKNNMKVHSFSKRLF